jgi:hypothetical protein
MGGVCTFATIPLVSLRQAQFSTVEIFERKQILFEPRSGTEHTLCSLSGAAGESVKTMSLTELSDFIKEQDLDIQRMENEHDEGEWSFTIH